MTGQLNTSSWRRETHGQRSQHDKSGREEHLDRFPDGDDVDGDKVGSVQQFLPQANCLLVEKGMLFKKDVYIPVSAIASTGVDGVRIDLRRMT